MKTILFSLLTFFVSLSMAQVSGEIAQDSRKIEGDIDYTLYSSSKTGILVYKIAVNTTGKVTGCTFDRSLSTVISTPLMMQGKNRILSELKFEAGNSYPKFHQGLVTITLVDVEEEEVEEVEEVEGN